MDRVRDLVAAGSVAVVLAQDRDRFVREPALHYLLRREFEEGGTKLRALNDRGDESPEGELTDGILALIDVRKHSRGLVNRLDGKRKGEVGCPRDEEDERFSEGFRQNRQE